MDRSYPANRALPKNSSRISLAKRPNAGFIFGLGCLVFGIPKTNITCQAEMIYPLYRFRWQIELLFKASKISLNMDQIPSGNRMIILNVFLSRMIAVLAAMLLRGISKKNTDPKKAMYVSIQRAANVFVNLKVQILDYFTSTSSFTKKRLIRSFELMFVEMVDPNFRSRKNTRAHLESLCLNN